MKGIPTITNPPSATLLSCIQPNPSSLAILEQLGGIINESDPLSGKQGWEIKKNVLELWQLLTGKKEIRHSLYLNTSPAISAYLRYFLPWNVFRISSILSSFPVHIGTDDHLTDLGSGPLSLPIALWACRPELRKHNLQFTCLDRSEKLLERGLSIFETVNIRMQGFLSPWKFTLVKGDMYTGNAKTKLPHKLDTHNSDFVAAVNVLNEIKWNRNSSLDEAALRMSKVLRRYLNPSGQLFLMEPGNPASATFLVAIRTQLLALGFDTLSPCPHQDQCPMPGKNTRHDVQKSLVLPKVRAKAPWCHFTIDTKHAPTWLATFSDFIGLPKSKVVFSYLHAQYKNIKKNNQDTIQARIVSEPFSLPRGLRGYYSCTKLGYTLLTQSWAAKAWSSGTLLSIVVPKQKAPMIRDPKSGAVILDT